MSVPTIKLSDAAEINPRLRARPTGDAPVSFLGMADVDAESGTTSRGEKRQFGDVAKGYTQFADSDLLVAKITPCFENGKIAQAKLDHPNGVGSTEFHVIRPDRSRLHDRFLLRFLRQPHVRIAGEMRMTGSGGQRRVPEAYLADLRVPLLPVEDQQRIAQVLDSVDVLRGQRRQAIALLGDLAQSIFLDMFGDVIGNNRNWPSGQVSDLVAKFESGKSFAAASEDESGVHFRILKVSAVTSGQFLPMESKPVPSGYEPPAAHIVRDGDLIFSRANTESLIGATAVVSQPPANLILPDKLWRFVWHDSGSASPLYVRQLFRQKEFRREIARRSSGTSGSMKNISQSKVLSIECGIPPVGLRCTYNERVKAIEVHKAKQQAHLAELDALFASLQHRAFRGELWADNPAA